MFDWDQIIVSQSSSAVLSSHIELCKKLFPCALKLKGTEFGQVTRVGNGSVSCLGSDGCSGLLLESVGFVCNDTESLFPAFQIQGSSFNISNSTFTGCISVTDGAVVRSYDNAVIYISSSDFRNTFSFGFGGAISLFGSSVYITATTFFNSTSVKGGGAIWASSFQGCYGSSEKRNTVLDVADSSFDECSSQGDGGAVLVFSYAENTIDQYVEVEILKSSFSRCFSKMYGGAIKASGTGIVASIFDTEFEGCSSFSGGAVSISNMAEIGLVQSSFTDNMAFGLGGGGVHLRNSALLLFESSFANNTAFQGGGGALFWQQSVIPSKVINCPPGMHDVQEACLSPIYNNSCVWKTCSVCAKGTANAKGGGPSCDDCQSGTYSDTIQSTSCLFCTAGKYSSKQAAISDGACALCSSGTFSKDGFSSCFLCQPGTFADSGGAAECRLCDAGKFVSVSGATTIAACHPCNAGTFSVAGASFCSACPKGTYSNDTNASFCTICAAGFFSYNIGSTVNSCGVCPAGWISRDGATQCTACAQGTFSSSKGSNQCTGCDVGKYSSWTGASHSQSCLDCNAGTFSSSVSSACLDCIAGAYSNTSGASECARCGIGKYSTAIGSNLAATCVLCNSGKFSDFSVGSSRCLACGSALYQQGYGASQDIHIQAEYCKLVGQNGKFGRFVPTGSYTPSESMYWIIAPPGASVISITFLELKVESGYDVVFVSQCHDHLCTNTTPLAWFTGFRIPPTKLFSASIILVSWLSDKKNNFAGWSALYTVVENQTNSQNHFIESEANISAKTNHITALLGQQDLHRSWLQRFYSAKNVSDSENSIKMLRLYAFTNKLSSESPINHSRFQYRKNDVESVQTRRGSNHLHNPEMNLKNYALICSDHNYASYGPCIASDYRSLLIQSFPDDLVTISPGLNFGLSVFKKDSYNQTINTDSTSVIQAHAVLDKNENHLGAAVADESVTLVGSTLSRLQDGIGTFAFAIKPRYSAISFLERITTMVSRPHILFDGIDVDTARSMQSGVFAIQMSFSTNVCPLGYILELDTATANGSAGCTQCKPGSYSVNPLAPSPYSADLQRPSCLNCPVGGNCAKGGAEVVFDVGNWTVENGIYILLDCPRGYQLVNTTSELQNGPFSPDAQQCKACSSSEYKIHSRKGSCQQCPKSAMCFEGLELLCALQNYPLVQCPSGDDLVGTWSIDIGAYAYVLFSCPEGYSLVTTTEAGSSYLQRCQPCSANQYIIEPNTDECKDCPPGASHLLFI